MNFNRFIAVAVPMQFYNKFSNNNHNDNFTFSFLSS